MGLNYKEMSKYEMELRARTLNVPDWFYHNGKKYRTRKWFVGNMNYITLRSQEGIRICSVRWEKKRTYLYFRKGKKTEEIFVRTKKHGMIKPHVINHYFRYFIDPEAYPLPDISIPEHSKRNTWLSKVVDKV